MIVETEYTWIPNYLLLLIKRSANTNTNKRIQLQKTKEANMKNKSYKGGEMKWEAAQGFASEQQIQITWIEIQIKKIKQAMSRGEDEVRGSCKYK